MNSLTAISKTTKNTYLYTLHVKTVNAEDINMYLNKEAFDLLCQAGCKNYNAKWSCPPHSPSYTTICKNYKYISVFCLSMDMHQFENVKNNYTKIKAANTMMKSRIDKVLRSKTGCFISTGSCRLCKPCKKKINAPCAHPEHKAFSFEALGVNVGAMIKEVFGIDLLWYKKGELPKYTTVVAGILTDSKINTEEYILELNSMG